ncbi:solute carrier family 35 member E3 [Elysia marginata]|uniref:Solute carrier family 35 member E3 n=1 Tax=Elysia marginata TaxID=1093978 RepID=A0AAV4FCF0_9GAST|nr:solute carrier family 35 member E3 [Elysia marginata]
MIGHLKFCMTLVGGYLLFHDPIQPFQFLGICCTVAGVIAYTHIKREEMRRKSLPTQLVSVNSSYSKN